MDQHDGLGRTAEAFFAVAAPKAALFKSPEGKGADHIVGKAGSLIPMTPASMWRVIASALEISASRSWPPIPPGSGWPDAVPLWGRHRHDRQHRAKSLLLHHQHIRFGIGPPRPDESLNSLHPRSPRRLLPLLFLGHLLGAAAPLPTEAEKIMRPKSTSFWEIP